MRRIAVFVFYDSEGVVDRYVEHILVELLKVSDRLIIAVNGFVNECGLKILGKYGSEIIIRSNTGLDAGAHADIIINHIGKEELKKWDELIICNDTFYGPFNGFECIFSEMNKYNYDFWGIDRVERDFLSYIIMYFCVFGSRLLKSGDLYEYFENYIYNSISDISDAYARFEVGLNYTLRKKGYSYGTYSFCQGLFPKSDPEICVEKYGLPICKKKFFSECFSITKWSKLFNHIKETSDYDTSFIKENVKRKYGFDIFKTDDFSDYLPFSDIKYSIPMITESEIEEFLAKHKRVYIYGTGSFARSVYFVFNNRIQEFAGFVVSKKESDYVMEKSVFEINEIPDDSAIIVAMNYNNSSQVINNLSDKMHCFLFWDIKGNTE